MFTFNKQSTRSLLKNCSSRNMRLFRVQYICLLTVFYGFFNFVMLCFYMKHLRDTTDDDDKRRLSRIVTEVCASITRRPLIEEYKSLFVVMGSADVFASLKASISALVSSWLHFAPSDAILKSWVGQGIVGTKTNGLWVKCQSTNEKCVHTRTRCPV